MQPQHHIPIPLPKHQLVGSTHIIQPIGPKIQHRPSPPYHNPYARPPPRPPDVTNSIDSWKDLLETDLDRNVKEEQEEVYNMLVEYREAFNLRDEIGTHPNIQIDSQIIDKSLFL